MSLGKKYKKRLKNDLLVVLVILLAVFLFGWISNRQAIWSIKKEQKIIAENLEIKKTINLKGNLIVDGSDLVFLPEYSGHLGMILEGDALLDLSDSKIDSVDYKWSFSSFGADGQNPVINLQNSELAEHTRLKLYDGSKLTAKDSEIGQVMLLNYAKLEAANSKITPYLFSDKSEKYEGLNSGDDVSLEFKSNQGWQIELDECEVDAFWINVKPGDDINISNSTDVILNIGIPDTVEISEGGASKIDIITNDQADGEVEIADFDISWDETTFKYINYDISSGDSFDIKNSDIGTLSVANSTTLNLSDLNISCISCLLQDKSHINMQNVDFTGKEGRELVIDSQSVIKVAKSNLTGLKIRVLGKSQLRLTDTKISNELLEVEDGSKVFFNGEEIDSAELD
jgi:hypothetical protein